MTTIPNNLSLLQEVRSRRYRENVANVFKLVGIFALALAAAWIVMLLAAPHRAWETSGVMFFLIWCCTIGVLITTIGLLLTFWPFLLYFWASVTAARQWTLLSLLQTSIETGKPLQDIVRAYATSCSSWYIIRLILVVALVVCSMPLSLLCLLLYLLYRMIRRKNTAHNSYAVRLNRFADSLESGCSLDAAIREHRELFRYDVAGIIRIGDSPETLRSLETVAHDERDFSAVRTYTVFRVLYLCNIVMSMFPVICFVMLKIVPEFEKIFIDFGTELPALTTIVISVSNCVVYYWYLAVPFILLPVVVAVVHLILQTNSVVFRPIGFRRIFRSTDAAKFLRVFAAGVRHRFPIPTILERYCWSVPSHYLQNKGMNIQKTVEQGGDWIDAVCRAGFVNRPEGSLLKSAQRTGNTATVLDQLAQSKERSQIRKDDLFSKLAFIPLVFLLGAVIGTFVIGMFVPLLKLIADMSV